MVVATEVAEFKTLPQIRPELVANATPPEIAEIVAVSAPGICSEKCSLIDYRNMSADVQHVLNQCYNFFLSFFCLLHSKVFLN